MSENMCYNEIMEKDLQKIMEMVENNNKMLRQIRGVQQRGWWIGFLKWIVLIVLAIGAFYFIQPFIENLNSAYESVMSGVENVQNTTNNLSGYFKAK